VCIVPSQQLADLRSWERVRIFLPVMHWAYSRVVKLPVIYGGVKLPVTYRPLPARMGHRALVLKGVGQSLGLMTVIITR